MELLELVEHMELMEHLELIHPNNHHKLKNKEIIIISFW
jgi:hypothetical protein